MAEYSLWDDSTAAIVDDVGMIESDLGDIESKDLRHKFLGPVVRMAYVALFGLTAFAWSCVSQSERVSLLNRQASKLAFLAHFTKPEYIVKARAAMWKSRLKKYSTDIRKRLSESFGVAVGEIDQEVLDDATTVRESQPSIWTNPSTVRNAASNLFTLHYHDFFIKYEQNHLSPVSMSMPARHIRSCRVRKIQLDGFDHNAERGRILIVSCELVGMAGNEIVDVSIEIERTRFLIGYDMLSMPDFGNDSWSASFNEAFNEIERKGLYWDQYQVINVSKSELDMDPATLAAERHEQMTSGSSLIEFAGFKFERRSALVFYQCAVLCISIILLSQFIHSNSLSQGDPASLTDSNVFAFQANTLSILLHSILVFVAPFAAQALLWEPPKTVGRLGDINGMWPAATCLILSYISLIILVGVEHRNREICPLSFSAKVILGLSIGFAMITAQLPLFALIQEFPHLWRVEPGIRIPLVTLVLIEVVCLLELVIHGTDGSPITSNIHQAVRRYAVMCIHITIVFVASRASKWFGRQI